MLRNHAERPAQASQHQSPKSLKRKKKRRAVFPDSIGTHHQIGACSILGEELVQKKDLDYYWSFHLGVDNK